MLDFYSLNLHGADLMGAHTLIFRDIAMVFTAALVCGLLAWRLRQPLILGYVLAGLILSPFTPGLRIHDVRTFETMAEIGIILLMFSGPALWLV